MKKLVTILMLVASTHSLANPVPVSDEVIENNKHKKIFTASLYNPEVLEAKCFVSKRKFTSISHDGSQANQNVVIEAEMEDGRIETGFLETKMTIVPENEPNNSLAKAVDRSVEFCDSKPLLDVVCLGVAVPGVFVVAPIAAGYYAIRDSLRWRNIAKFTNQTLKDINIPNCEE